MTVYVVLLRGINVGGHKQVAMADLRALVEELGFGNVRSLLQTGNLVFEGDARTAAGIERLLEVESAKRLDLRTDYFVRSAKEWQAIISGNPFGAAAKTDPSHLVVQLLKDAPPASAVQALRAAIAGPEQVRAGGKQLYVVYPDGIGRSKLTLKLMEYKLSTRVTGRNWNTVRKLGELARA